MRLGLISDVHADLTALEKALHLLDFYQVDQILCAGDLVEGGQEGDGVVRRIQERTIMCVQGNHDREAFADQAWAA